MKLFFLLLTSFNFLATIKPNAAFTIQSLKHSPSLTKVSSSNECSSCNGQHFSIYPHLRSNRKSKISLLSSSDVINNESKALEDSDDDDDEEDEWEFEEYEDLRETDFYNSEWKVGTLMDGSNNIEETWTRLIVQDGEFICVWGDGSNGKWNFDAASQFLSMSKDSFGGWLGKRIWAGSVDDFYYVQGTIRGWSPISPASVIGQWQAKRLGVDKDEVGLAPWFQDDEEEEGQAKQLEDATDQAAKSNAVEKVEASADKATGESTS